MVYEWIEFTAYCGNSSKCQRPLTSFTVCDAFRYFADLSVEPTVKHVHLL